VADYCRMVATRLLNLIDCDTNLSQTVPINRCTVADDVYFSVSTRGVRNVIKSHPGTRINFERVPGYPLKIHNSTITVIESCWSGRHQANN